MEKGEESIGGPKSRAGHVGEVLGDVVVSPQAGEGKQRAKFSRRGWWSPCNPDDGVEGVKKGVNAGDVRGAFVGHSKEDDERISGRHRREGWEKRWRDEGGVREGVRRLERGRAELPDEGGVETKRER